VHAEVPGGGATVAAAAGTNQTSRRRFRPADADWGDPAGCADRVAAADPARVSAGRTRAIGGLPIPVTQAGNLTTRPTGRVVPRAVVAHR